MKKLFVSALAASVLSLTACGGQGDDSLGDNAADAADAQAENLDARADALEEQADDIRDAGEEREEAIDESDINADALTPEQQSAVANGQ